MQNPTYFHLLSSSAHWPWLWLFVVLAEPKLLRVISFFVFFWWAKMLLLKHTVRWRHMIDHQVFFLSLNEKREHRALGKSRYLAANAHTNPKCSKTFGEKTVQTAQEEVSSGWKTHLSSSNYGLPRANCRACFWRGALFAVLLTKKWCWKTSACFSVTCDWAATSTFICSSWWYWNTVEVIIT